MQQRLFLLMRRYEVRRRDPDVALGIVDGREKRDVIAGGIVLWSAAYDPDHLAAGRPIGALLTCSLRHRLQRIRFRGVRLLGGQPSLLAPMLPVQPLELGDHWSRNLQIRVVPDI